MLRFVRFEKAKKYAGTWRGAGTEFIQVNPEAVAWLEEISPGATRIVCPPGSTTVVSTEDEVLRALVGTPIERLARVALKED